ncbi:MAG: GNAT family N-acetyltransferase [Candidatus Micrarchaeia archaeon]|jgi:RimJ/RimL family protein N-acetyltransferase
MQEKKLKPFGIRKMMLGKSRLVLRPNKMSDAKALNDIVNEPGVNDFLMTESPLSLQSTKKVLKEDKKHLWIVSELDGKVVGSISIRPGIGRHDIVCQFGIAYSKSVHGKGVAKASLSAVLDWMRENGFDNCTERVLDNNGRARAFYRKMGFKEICHMPRQMRTKNGIVGVYAIQKKL